MVTCGSYMFEFSVSKDVKKIIIKWLKENFNISSSVMSNTTCQGVEN